MNSKISNPRAAELLAELPEDLHAPVSKEEELHDLLSVLATKPVPTGRLISPNQLAVATDDGESVIGFETAVAVAEQMQIHGIHIHAHGDSGAIRVEGAGLAHLISVSGCRPRARAAARRGRVNTYQRRPSLPTIYPDHRDATRMEASTSIETGHNRVALSPRRSLVSSPTALAGSRTGRARRQQSPPAARSEQEVLWASTRP